jgi:hypothetical protein
MHQDTADQAQLRRELSHVREYLERIIKAASNPECFECAEVRHLAHEGLATPPASTDDWAT